MGSGTHVPIPQVINFFSYLPETAGLYCSSGCLVRSKISEKIAITQFVSARDRDNASHTFTKFLDLYGIKHIIARVKHPQTNGKIERFFGEVERRLPSFGSIDKITMRSNRIPVSITMNHIMHSGTACYLNESWDM